VKHPTETQLVKARLVRYGTPGAADVLGVLPPAGRLLALECKRPGGKLTAAQAAFLGHVRAAGGLAVVVRDVRDLQRALEAEDTYTEGKL
jgi:hypothetical protein